MPEKTEPAASVKVTMPVEDASDLAQVAAAVKQMLTDLPDRTNGLVFTVEVTANRAAWSGEPSYRIYHDGNEVYIDTVFPSDPDAQS